MQWIKCSDRMPEDSSHDRFLLWNGCYVRQGKWLSPDCSGNNCCWHDDYDHKIKGKRITHWMPLPKPPEE